MNTAQIILLAVFIPLGATEIVVIGSGKAYNLAPFAWLLVSVVVVALVLS